MTGLLNPFATEAALAAVRSERERQDEQWGEQNHRPGTGPATMPLACFDPLMPAEDLAEAAREITDAGLGAKLVTFRDILLEEVFEALAETEPEKLRRELVQVAAVATQWVEAIERRRIRLHAVESEVTHLPDADAAPDRTSASNGGVAGLSPAHRQPVTTGGAS